MMDEYVPVPPPTAHYSCRGFALREIAAPLGIPDERVWLPDPDDPAAYDERIASAGGIDLFLLASGASDGHVAFLPPGSPRDGRTSVVRLAESTRRDNLATFPEFASVDDVPTHGVSVGLGTIAARARLRLVLHGADKRAAAARVARARPLRPVVAGEHRARPSDDAEILVDARERRLARENGTFAMVAMDQRESLRTMLRDRGFDDVRRPDADVQAGGRARARAARVGLPDRAGVRSSTSRRSCRTG